MVALRRRGSGRSTGSPRSGAAGALIVAALGLASEPIRWPFAHSRRVALVGKMPGTVKPFLAGLPDLAALPRIRPDGRRILAQGKAGLKLPSRDFGRFAAKLTIMRRSTRSANVLGILPGTDPGVADQVVVVSA